MSCHAVYQETLSAPKAIIAGREVDAADGRTLPVVSPIDESVIAHLPDCGDAEISAAVAAARRAFDDRHWAGLAPKERKMRMLRWADLIESRSEELAILQTRDMGMPLRVARAGDIGSAISCIRWYAEAIDKIYGEIAPAPDNETVLIERIPLGVVGAIIPWNFPAMIAAWKLGPALAIGNSVVLKPAEDASLVALKLGLLALEAGIPEGVLNVVPGAGSTAGAALALHADVDALTFTGSGRVGRFILEASARSNLKRVSLECGGKSANIIMADTPDLPAAVAAGVRAVFNNQGQVCNAPSRLYEDLLRLGVIVRPVANYGLPEWLRISIGLPVENSAMLDGLNAILLKRVPRSAVS